METLKQKKKACAKICQDAKLKNISKHLTCLHSICGGLGCNEKQRQNVIKNMDKNQMKAVQDIVCQFLDGKIELPKKSVSKYKKDKELFYKIKSKKVSDKNKKDILIQKGGVIQVLPMLLSALAPTLLDIILK